ncbi:duodenase-1-like [Anarhichas minor]|uniref:duodenase-1-like n=1 Tax=Anarhichas minor TaxID=65739 RepID=UPI003F739731
MHPLHTFLLFPLLAYLGRSADGSEIINGELAPENSMLYMASVQNSKGHECGGFLISEDFVLTAAHCDLCSGITHVVLGTHDLKSVNDDNKISIKEKYKHESYVKAADGNDIMLLKLSKNVSLNGRVQTIPLPTSEMNTQDDCQVAGWGAIKTGGPAVDDLRVVDVSIIDLEVCTQVWGSLPANVMCAGGYGTEKGFCQGDSGGPLVCNGKAVGVVSFNRAGNCNYSDVPNVYTDVSNYLLWIDDILNCYK